MSPTKPSKAIVPFSYRYFIYPRVNTQKKEALILMLPRSPNPFLRAQQIALALDAGNEVDIFQEQQADKFGTAFCIAKGLFEATKISYIRYYAEDAVNAQSTAVRSSEAR